MKLTIHRGTKEIGGSCVELNTATTKILIDFGMPLVDKKKEPFGSKILKGKSIEELQSLKILPDIKGLYKNEEKGIDAILISHSHLDHYGLLNYVHPEIPVYLSEGAQRLIEVSNIFVLHKTGSINFKILKKNRKTAIGAFSVTAHLVDHSAFDALAFLIESEGKRLFYSGDFRGHGRKSSLFKNMIKNPPKDIDYLLMEGSMLGRDNQDYKNENEIERKIEETLKESKNITFLFASSQNIDRLVSAYRACLKTNATFVIDIYTAFVLDKLRKVSKNIPQFNWKNIRIKFIKYHADCLANSGYRDLLYVYNKRKIEIFEINRNKNKILMLSRDNSKFPLIVKKIDSIQGARIIYSMWEGSLTDEFKQYCAQKKLTIEQVHTSGHAILEDLQTFANALNPRALIPIHTFEAQRYPQLFKNVKILEDGEELDLC
ncbi:MAG: MBL fold metallo-hydrolase [Candidatus Aureabacteria bacterium]|nr:MBL fold metallo-hydrolase [Candidatus Auribacterota bacterium]